MPAESTSRDRSNPDRPPPSGEAPARTLRLSVVTCAYNEEANIGRFLESCLKSPNETFQLAEIVVVASGCTDRTVEIVNDFASRDPRIRLILQPTRAGKASALALGLREVRGDVVLIAGSDTSPAVGALREVVRPFADPQVSLVCTRPTPMDTSNTFTVNLAKTLWDLHHVVSTLVPKAGEAFAVRNRSFDIPADIQDDDTYLGSISVVPGTKAVYADKAIFFNRIPTTAPDFLRQRWRINRQEVGLERSTGIQSTTWQPQVMLRAIGEFVREKPGSLPYLCTLAAAEITVRLGAMVATPFIKEPLVRWTPIQSTKDSAAPGNGRENAPPP